MNKDGTAANIGMLIRNRVSERFEYIPPFAGAVPVTAAAEEDLTLVPAGDEEAKK